MSGHFSVAQSMQFTIRVIVLVNILSVHVHYYLMHVFFALAGLFPQLCKKRPAGDTVVENACLLVSLHPSANV